MAAMQMIFYGITVAFCVIGGVMLGVGIWLAVDNDAQEAFAVAGLNEDLFWTSVYFMIIIGSFVLLVSFLGMFGASSPKKNKWALFGFIGVVGFILILELIMIIITGVFWDSIDAGTRDQMLHDVQINYVDEYANDTVSVSWNNMQIDWRCCGSRDYNDYDESKYKETTTNEVPWTCCVMKSGGRTLDQVVNVDACRLEAENTDIIEWTSDYLHMRGCYSGIKDVLESHSILLIALSITFFAIEIGGMVVAFLLIRED